MQRVVLHVPAGQRLVVDKDHGVVFGVGLVGPLVHPPLLPARLRAEPPNVIAAATQPPSMYIALSATSIRYLLVGQIGTDKLNIIV